MLTLYYKPTCPFCRRVIAVIERLELEDVIMRDVSTDESAYEELEKIGGKRQVPFLYDDNLTPNNTSDDIDMYESDTIVKHLQDHYGTGGASAAKPRVHISDATCISCEG